MKKNIFTFVTIMFSISLCTVILTACSHENNQPQEIAYAYCADYYSASYGNFGTFSIEPIDDNQLETQFDDLSKFSLGAAFMEMRIDKVSLSDDGYKIIFKLSGSLSSGNFGTIEGSGIIIGKTVKCEVPIVEAIANSESVIYENVVEQQIKLDLSSACFNKKIIAQDFKLSGAARNMTIKSAKAEPFVDENGEEHLSQSATLTLTGSPDGTDYAYIEILNSATTFNESLKVSLGTDYYGAYAQNENIDTSSLSDKIYIQANNISFKNSLVKENITLGGALKDYAQIKSIEYVSDSLIVLNLSFPYNFLTISKSEGIVTFNEKTNVEGISFSCSILVAAPMIDYSLNINANKIKIDLTLLNEQFNLLDMYPFSVYTSNGTEILANNIVVENLGENLSISFSLPKNCKGLLYFELKDAYDIVNFNGQAESVTIKTHLYI